MRRLLIAIPSLLILCTSGWQPAASPAEPATQTTAVQGMTISCRGAGRVWGTDAMVDTMAKLKDLGVNWIAIHPYAGIRPDGTVGGSRIDGMYADPLWLTRPIEEAHRLGLKILIKPHIAYWGSPFSWRGEIKFTTEEQWSRFFATYEKWITMVAELSAHADGFAVGTELGGTAHRETEWRTIIRRVREVYDGPLTYAANWDRYQRVPFWDALDVIGIQSYFPLVKHENLPTQHELDQAWSDLIGRLRRFSTKHDRPILLAELGYNRSALAAYRPWEYRQGGAHGEEIQKRCLTAALKAIDKNNDVIVGAFLWKWFPGEPARGDFNKSSPAMREVIHTQWGEPAPATAPVESP